MKSDLLKDIVPIIDTENDNRNIQILKQFSESVSEVDEEKSVKPNKPKPILKNKVYYSRLNDEVEQYSNTKWHMITLAAFIIIIGVIAKKKNWLPSAWAPTIALFVISLLSLVFQ